jgi:HEAT repeat protein
MGMKFPSLLVTEKKEGKAKKRTNMVEEFKKIIPLMKESTLVKILILLTLLPNVIIPILNYQFNFAVNQQFATQSGMLAFFGYFRGSMNIVNLIILLFIGRVYGRFGLPVVLMFHPFNYVIAFLGFLFRFDIFSAIYARVTTNVLRTTMNNPARAVLMGLFPVSYRAVIRPFLRGTVVRIGVLLGAGLVMISEGLFHPRFLSIIALVFVGAWILSGFFLKRAYPKILLDLISKNMLDLKSLEESDIGNVFMDKKIHAQLVDSFLSARGDDCLWYARLLKSLSIEGLDKPILSAIRQQDDKTKIELLPLLSPEAGQEAFEVFKEIVNPDRPDLTVAILKTANRFPAELSAGFSGRIYESSKDPELRAYAVTCLYRQKPEDYKEIIDNWLESDDPAERRAGVIAVSESGESAYIPRLIGMSDSEKDEAILPLVLKGLRGLRAPETNAIALPYLSNPNEPVRLAALGALEIGSDDHLKRVIAVMDDSSDQLHELAKEKIQVSDYQNTLLLIESLNIPRRKVREGIFDLLESLSIKELDVFRFARSQLGIAYTCLAEAEGLRLLPESRERDLLIDHLLQKKLLELENILRVLAIQDPSGQIRTIWRGISSADARQRSNSLEALDELLNSSLFSIIIPLLEDRPIYETLKVGKKNFDIPEFDAKKTTIYSHLLAQEDWVTVILTLKLICEHGLRGLEKSSIEGFESSENAHVRSMAQRVIDRQDHDSAKSEDDMETEMSIPDKILRLRGIQIFEGLSVNELAAISTVTEEADYPQGQIVIREGEPGDTMYLVIKGQVSVIKGMGAQEGAKGIELARIGVGDYFGEMALFEDTVRSASIRTEEHSRLLVLHKREFTEIVREYPQIALHICKALSGRIRELHEKLQVNEK